MERYLSTCHLPGSDDQGVNKEVINLSHHLWQDSLPLWPSEPPGGSVWVTRAGRWSTISDRDLPGLQWHVAIQHPAVLKLDGLRRGGQVVGRGSRGVDLAPPIGQGVPVEGVGGRVVMGQRVVVRRWQRGPQGCLAVVVRRAWKKRRET